jgi:hypothetical protein
MPTVFLDCGGVLADFDRGAASSIRQLREHGFRPRA